MDMAVRRTISATAGNPTPTLRLFWRNDKLNAEVVPALKLIARAIPAVAVRCGYCLDNIITHLIKALPDNSPVNTVQRATTDAPIDWLDSDHVICVYCRSISALLLYKSDRFRSGYLRVMS
jgi:hypothetical protein